jgi:hypothetical protein
MNKKERGRGRERERERKHKLEWVKRGKEREGRR